MALGDDVPVVVADRRWVWLRPTVATTLREVADTLAAYGVNVRHGDGVVVEGRVVPADVTLPRAGVHAGTQLGHGVRPPPDAPGDGWIDVVVTGGDGSGVLHRLPPGRFLLGSAEGLALRVAGRGVVPHAAVVRVGGHRDRPQVSVTHLAGPALTVGEGTVDDVASWPLGAPLIVGTALMHWSATRDAGDVVRPAHTMDGEGHTDVVWWRVHRRRGRQRTQAATHDVQPAPADVAPPPLAPGVVAATTSAVMAALVRQPWLAVVALSSLTATGGWWLSARMRSRRRRLRWVVMRDEQREQRAHQARLERPALHDLMAMADGRRVGLWERRAQHHDDVWHVGLGRGHERLGDGDWWYDVPVVVSLGPGARLGVAGRGAVPLARAMLAHLVTHVGPADVSLRVQCAEDDDRFSDLEVLPHARCSAAHQVVLVVDPGPGARAASGLDPDAAWVVVDERELGDRVEAWCTTVVRWDGTPHEVEVTHGGDVVARVVPAGVTGPWLHELVRRLVVWHDTEACGSTIGPEASDQLGVSWAQCHGVDLDPTSVVRRWATQRGGVPGLLGWSDGGVVQVDLVRDGPHALVAGTTGSGKSELLRTLVTSWAWHMPPDRLHIVLVDYKGGAAFDACARLPHVVGVVTDLDGDTSSRVLMALQAELTRRERALRAVGVRDVAQWRDDLDSRAPPRLIIVVDEVAALVHERPEVVTALVALAQRGRSLGVHLVLATQRPAGVVRDDVRANTELRICLRVADRADALDVVGDARPAFFDRGQPGRALLRSGAGTVCEVQVIDTSRTWDTAPPAVDVRPHGWQPSRGSVTAPVRHGPSTLDTVVDLLATVAQSHGYPKPGGLWRPALPAVLEHDPDSDDHTIVGMLDDVAHQRWLPLRCDARGHAVIIGGPRSGVTTALARIVATRADHQIIEWRAGEPCAPVMERLLAVLDERAAGPVSQPAITVLVDDVGALRRRWEHELGTAAWQISGWWDRLLAEGPTLGVVLLAGADRMASCGSTLIAVATTRWLMRPLDPLDPAHLGVRWPVAQGQVCPPGRLVDATTGLVGQVAFSTPSTMCTVRSA